MDQIWSRGILPEHSPDPAGARVINRAHILPKASHRLRSKKCVLLCRHVVENKYIVVLTTILTLYALVGDDLRLISTNKPADGAFDVVTIVCFTVFFIEILLSCIGKRDYLFGFFFWLDVVSTFSLGLDISLVSEFLEEVFFNQDSEMKDVRSGRTARVGARAGRVVRVIRLVRILKLYKAFYEAKARQNSMRAVPVVPIDDDWGEDDDDDNDEEEGRITEESRVGKKLSELTTRKVIILVLTMLLVLPYLQVQSILEVPSSGMFGADDVWEDFIDFQQTPASNISWQAARDRYQNSLLKYIYYHNWFDKKSLYLSAIFWIGAAGNSEHTVQAQVSDLKLETPRVLAWSEKVRHTSYWTTMPLEVNTILTSLWTSPCDDAKKGIFRRGFSLLQQKIPDQVDYVVRCPKDLRTVEYSRYYPTYISDTQFKHWHMQFYFDRRPFVRREALYNIFITVFLCFLLVVASVYFSYDANRLVLTPLENMITRVSKIRSDPLVAMKMADEEFKVEEKQKAKMRRQEEQTESEKSPSMWECSCFTNAMGESHKTEAMETVILEKTIIKLGSLLALGFGEAGASIIGHHMRHHDSACIDVMKLGRKVECIVCRVRIQDFSIATEVLQAKVMTFANQVAEIVHGVVDEFHGSANKNNGDTFLLIWRLPERDEGKIARVADMSVFTLAKIFASVHKSPVLAQYRTHPGLQKRLTSSCRVNLSFGSHAGWAIEGAVGTEFKIDPSYLSPNVSIAESVEGATSIYGVPIILSESVVGLSSRAMASKCRLIDRVMMLGSRSPLRLYALDLDHLNIPVENPEHPHLIWNSRQRFRARQFMEQEKQTMWDSEPNLAAAFDSNEDIVTMRRPYTVRFLQLFNMGYQNYSEGEWQVARRMLSDTLNMLRKEDGPSQALLRYMETSKFNAPPKWPGYRKLQQPVQG